MLPKRYSTLTLNKLMNKNFKISFKTLLKHNKEGSYSTHANRCARVEQTMETLAEKYTGLQNVREIKTRHVNYLVEKWKGEGLSAGTIKNRMTDLRWLSRKIGKPNIVHRTNDEYGIERRQFTHNENNIAKTLEPQELERVSNEYVQQSLQLQEAFGLRREESIKFQPQYADKGDHIRIKDTWAKGGRYREVPITTEKQREVLNNVREFCRENGSRSLIPPEKNYRQQLAIYEKQCSRGELYKNHGLRHNYAQERYKDLTGWECPKRGGKLASDMTADERTLDRLARLTVSQELGHNREDVTNNYLGGKR